MKTKLILLLAGLLTTVYIQANSVKEAAFLEEATQSQSRYGNDSTTCVMNFSLYREFLKQWRASDYTNRMIYEIINPWRWVFKNCPLASENIYVDGVRIMQFQIENAKSEAEKEKYIDTLMMVYDQRLAYFPEFHDGHSRRGTPQQGSILGRKGVDLYTLSPDRYDEVYKILKKSVELEGNLSDGTVLIYYFRSVIRMARAGAIDSTLIVDTYDQIIDILDLNIKGYIEQGDSRWEEIYKNFKGNIEATFEPFATCQDMVRIYSGKLEKNPSDIELLKKVTSVLDRRNCQDDPLYLSASMRLHELEPSPESAFHIGRLLLREKKYSDAIPFLSEATASENVDQAHLAYRLLGEIYREMNNYPRARQMALRAIELDPGDGNPYILIGDMYAASAKDCGDGDFYGKVAYWAAVDKYLRARQSDPSVAELANSRISAYQPYFPSPEAIFFNDFKEGDTFTVECWINENTTIRAAKQ
jgi:tetratricopeptide (TPR) repeat protein